ncbi:MAG: GNAT family N-acetyltransferase [Hyphomicrobiales bacterium]|nr:GNAT family N-acetyltransferase [Hyphomicrobiales bacterium]
MSALQAVCVPAGGGGVADSGGGSARVNVRAVDTAVVESEAAAKPARYLVDVELITDVAQLEALTPEWEELHASLSPRTPFQSPLWCLGWWKHNQRGTVAAHDELYSFAIRNADGELVGVAPMFVTFRPGRGPVRMRELQFFGADPYVTEMRGIICRPEYALDILEAVEQRIFSDGICDWVQWRGLQTPGDYRWTGSFASDPVMDTIDYYIEPGDSWDVFRSGLSRNIKESLRKCYNSLARDGHEFELRVVDRPEDTASALETFFKLHRNRAEQANGVEHGNVFEREAERNFLLDVCQQFAERNCFRAFQLVIGGEAVATRIGFVLDDELYLYFSGYDGAWGRYSVMTTTVAEAIKWAIGNGVRIVNLSTGTDVSKTRWRPRSVQLRGGYQIAPNIFSRTAFKLFSSCR